MNSFVKFIVQEFFTYLTFVTLVVFCVVVILYGKGYWLDNSEIVKDEILIEKFKENRNLFEWAIQMFRDDQPLTIVQYNFADNGDLSVGRIQEYNALLTKLGVHGITSMGKQTVNFVVHGKGVISGEATKGYMYLPMAATASYQNLDTIPDDLPKNRIGFRKIDEDWYLYLVNDE